jgi:hypothetical protein
MSKQTEVAVSDRRSPTDKVTARGMRNLAMTPAAEKFLGDLSHKTGLSEGEVLRLALGMFKTAVDAKQQGKHVGVVSTPDVLDIELVGF